MCGFQINFVTWIKNLSRNQEPCIINGESITKYFNLEKDERQFNAVKKNMIKNGYTLIL